MTHDATTPTIGELDPEGELALDPSALVAAVGTFETIVEGAHGLASAAESLRTEKDRLADLVANRPEYREVRCDILPTDAAKLIEWAFDSSVRGIVDARGSVRLTGEWEEVGGVLLADAKRGRAARARLTSDLGEFVIDLGSNPPRVFRIVLPEVPRVASRASEDAPIVVPPLPTITGGLETAAWLADAFTARVVSPRALVRIAAVGLVGRLWSPKEADARALVERALSGELLPADRARTWARENQAAIRRVLPAALSEASDLEELLEDAPESLDDELAPALRLIVDRRDDLESFAFVARETGEAHSLDAALRELDAVATTQATLLDVEVDLGAEPRYREVLVTEPLAWWGLLARPR